MKTKNVTLGVIAFVFAIGSAFGSLLLPRNVYVKAKMTPAPDAPTICLNTQTVCDDAGIEICQVTVPVIIGESTASSNYNIRVYKTGCSTSIYNSFSVVRNSGINPVYRLVYEGEEEEW